MSNILTGIAFRLARAGALCVLVGASAAPAAAQLGGITGGVGGGIGVQGGIGPTEGLGGLERLPERVVEPVIQPEAPLDRTAVPEVLDAAAATAGDAADALTDLGEAVNEIGRPPDPAAVAQDALGNPVVSNEVLTISPAPEGLALAQALNFSVLRDQVLDALGMRIVTLGTPPGMSAAEGLNALRMADPNGAYELNHLYGPSASASRPGEGSASPAPLGGRGLAIGMVDGGIDRAHASLAQAKIEVANFGGVGDSPPSAHGTAVASLLVGRGAVNGAVPDATLYAADAFGGQPAGGSAEAVVRGMAWIAGKGAKVINVSLVGPENAVLETALNALSARGVVVVAAVGNDGPAARVGYPAAYDGVIAVTSVDRSRAIQVNANRGPEVEFAAYGVDVAVAAPGNGYGRATGTSFAAPLVAARFALKLAHPNESAPHVKRDLAAEAADLGTPGRDDVFGYGFLEAAPDGGGAPRK